MMSDQHLAVPNHSTSLISFLIVYNLLTSNYSLKSRFVILKLGNCAL